MIRGKVQKVTVKRLKGRTRKRVDKTAYHRTKSGIGYKKKKEPTGQFMNEKA